MSGAARSGPRGDRHPWSDEELAIYLLGELPEAEMEAVDAHLTTCAACREALARLDEVYVASVENLAVEAFSGEDPPGDELPAALWQGIDARTRGREAPRSSDAAHATPQATPKATPDANPDATADATPNATRQAPPQSPVPPTGRSTRRQAPARAPRSRRPRVSWALVATLALLAVTGGWGAWQRQLVSEARADVASLEARVQLLQDVVGTVEARADALQTDQARLASWLARDAVTTSRLSAADDGTAPGSVLVQADGRALVVMRELPAEGRDFQAWGVRDGNVTSLGAFEGRTLEVDVGTYEAVAVSLEPDGGSPAPTEVLGSAGTS